MRQALLVAAFGLGELALAAWLWPGVLAALLIWVGGVTLLVATAIGSGWTGLLGKRPDGTVPWWSYALFAPWHGVVRASAARARAREPVVQALADGWFLGGWPAPAGPWGAVVDLTCELPRRCRDGAYCAAPTWDGTAPSDTTLAEAARWAAAQRELGPVLVHCAHGHARSATVMAAAWVLCGEASSWQEAIERMASRRPTVRLTRDQRAALERWTVRERH
jgi:hypothetical protein